jgi:ABC-type Fe3+ transport system permease subunit
MDFGDFVGESIEGTLGVFILVFLLVVFFWVVIKIIEVFANQSTRASGLDPKSEQGEKRSTRIGFTLLALFLIFALLVAPLLTK